MIKNAALLVSLLVVGCVDAETEIPTDEIDVLPKLATNALTPAQLAAASIGPAPLTQSALNSYAVNVNARAALTYIVGCALPAGNSVTATYTEGGTQMQMTYNGEIGLAPSWTTTALTTTEQQLLSGCVLARVNLTGVAVTVSLRGPSTALAVVGTEATYSKQEGAFFGSIFQGPTFYLGACKGAATAPANRRCAQSTGTLAMVTECGFSYAGLCSDVCAAGTFFSDCIGGNGTVYDSAVTTYLK